MTFKHISTEELGNRVSEIIAETKETRPTKEQADEMENLIEELKRRYYDL